ncbi:MAG: DUF7948 domain-containing protein [Armatimonadota bacterium]
MRFYRYLILSLMFVSLYAIVSPAISANKNADARVARLYGKLPLSFVENRGQMDKRARYVIRGPRASAFFRNDGVTFDLWEASKKKPLNKQDILQKSKPEKPTKPEVRKHAVLKLTFKGADPKCRVKGMDALPGKANYMIGKDKSKWHTDVPTFKGVTYKNVWQGIDVIYRGDRRQLKYDIRVNPGADIRKVQLRYDGAQRMWLDKKGTLHIKTAVTEFIETVPGIYQEKSGKKIDVAGGYRLLDKHTVGFDVNNADPNLPLVIDPASNLVYSTYLGGTSDDSGYSIAVDSSGCAYVTGRTYSPYFPTTPGAFDASHGGYYDAFATKLNTSGSGLEYSTYLGGTSTDYGNSIAVDSAGCAYVTGLTSSSDFPTTPGAFDASLGGSYDAFAAKLNTSGSGLEYSTFLGGTSDDYGYSIVVDSSGCAYVTGCAYSSDFPTTLGAFDASLDGSSDVFATKLNTSGSGLEYSTYLGGTSDDSGNSIAIDSSGCTYVTGYTTSSDFLTTPGAFDASFGGYVDTFAAKLNTSGSGLEYSTFLGGTSDEYGYSIAVDSSGYAYVTGSTYSSDFPTTLGTFDASHNGYYDAFATKLNTSGSGLEYSTYLGGTSDDYGNSIAIDSSGCAYVTGSTTSSDFPTTPGVFDASLGGSSDAFVTKLNTSGSRLEDSSFLGGTLNDYGYSIAVDSSGCAYVTGSTYSSDFPTTLGAFDASYNGNGEFDAFVAKLNMRNTKPDLLIKSSTESSYTGTDIFNTDGTDQTKSQNAAPNQKVTYAFKVRNAGDANDSFKITGPAGGSGWSVRYYDLNTSAELTSQVTGSGWTSGTLAPGASKGIYASIKPDASVPAGSVNTLIITAASEADDSKIDVVKAVTSFVGTYKTDMLIKTGVDISYRGFGTYNTDGTNQTKSQNVSAGQKVICAFRAMNGGNAYDSFRITGTAGGNGWTVKYLDLTTNVDVTSQMTDSGWSSGMIAPGIMKGVYAQIKPDATVPIGSSITLTITGISESDNSKIDVVKSVNVCVASYKPDLLIKLVTESTYTGLDIINADGTDQTKSQNAAINQKVTCAFRVRNAGYLSDSFKITGQGGGSGWSVKYYDLTTGADVTSQVTGTGWISGTLAPGLDKGVYAKITPDATVTSGSSKTLTITATSISAPTKIDVVKAMTTVP